MSPLVYALLAMIAVGAGAFALVPDLFSSDRADKRRDIVKATDRLKVAGNDPSVQRESRRKTVEDALKAQSEKHSTKVSLQQQIYQAGMRTKKNVFIRNSIIVGVVVAIVSFVLEVPILFACVFGAAVAYIGPKLYLTRRRKKFQSSFLDELPNAVEAIVRGVKSGLPLNDCIKSVATDAKEPVRTEFARIVDQQAFGKTTAESITILFDRVPLPEVNFFVVVITVQQQAGGNLSEALTNLGVVLRNRKKMQAKVKALSSEATASAGIIGSLPFVVGTLVTLTTPSYLLPLIQTPVGQICLGIAVVLMCTGMFIMKKMISFDY